MHFEKADLRQINSSPKTEPGGFGYTDQEQALFSEAPFTGAFWGLPQLSLGASGHEGFQTAGGSTTHPSRSQGPAKWLGKVTWPQTHFHEQV